MNDNFIQKMCCYAYLISLSYFISLYVLWYVTQLSRKVVQNIHLSGGSLLGVSRGGPTVTDIVESMEVNFKLLLISGFIIFSFEMQYLFQY